MSSHGEAIRLAFEGVAPRLMSAMVAAALTGVVATSAAADPPAKVPRAVPIELPRPEYPVSLRSAGVAGKVTVRVTVGADGRVQDVDPFDGPKMMWAAVVPAASQSVFECRDCHDGSARYVVIYEFKLQSQAPPEARQPPPVFNARQARVTVIGQGRQVIPNDVPREEVRAARCLWLWRCGSRPRD